MKILEIIWILKLLLVTLCKLLDYNSIEPNHIEQIEQDYFENNKEEIIKTIFSKIQ